MASILNIETATTLCSVALSIDGKTVAQRETYEERSHAARLTVFIEEILKEKNLKIHDLDAIAVGKGPGSYTGLRIGVSTVKGLCYGSTLPLIAVNTLKILYQQLVENVDPHLGDLLARHDVRLCPMIDARRMEVFTCLYNTAGDEVESIAARIIDPETFSNILSAHPVIFFGTGMEKCRAVITHPHAVFVADVYPHASSLAILAEELYKLKKFENLAYFEPFYLKDFIATTSKKDILV